jgi:RNA 3'-terminal phosphate cyclase (ATP)
VREVWFPVLGEMGVSADLELLRWGFYPKGGGRMYVAIEGGARLRPASLVSRQGAARLRGLSAVANLPRGIAERQREHALRRLEAEGRQADIALVEAEAAGAGSFLILVVDAGGVPAGFSAVGERGKPAERVADEAVDPLLDFLKGDAACDPHLADQLILPMALAGGTSRLTTSRVTPHLLTTVRLVQQALGCPMEVGGEEGSPGYVTIRETRAESREPRAASREPTTESREPRAVSTKTRAECRELRAESRELRAESREHKDESRVPRAESRAPSTEN